MTMAKSSYALERNSTFGLITQFRRRKYHHPFLIITFHGLWFLMDEGTKIRGNCKEENHGRYNMDDGRCFMTIPVCQNISATFYSSPSGLWNLGTRIEELGSDCCLQTADRTAEIHGRLSMDDRTSNISFTMVQT
jgi:hypothetical protein